MEWKVPNSKYQLYNYIPGRIWLHIRSAGNWTKSLYKYFDQYDPGETNDEETVASLAPTNPIDRRMRATLKHNSLGKTYEYVT